MNRLIIAPFLVFAVSVASPLYANLETIRGALDGVGAGIMGIGVSLAGLIFAIDYFFKIDFLTHFIQEYKRKIFFALIFISIIVLLEDTIAEYVERFMEPTAIFYNR